MTVAERPNFGLPKVIERPVKLDPIKFENWKQLNARALATAVLRPDIQDYVGLPWANGKEPGQIDLKSQSQAAEIILDAFKDTSPTVVLGIGNSGLSLAEEVVTKYRSKHPTPSKIGSGTITNQERVVEKVPHSGTLFTARSYYRGRDVSFHIPSIEPGTKALVIDDVCAHGSISLALIQKLQELGVDVVGFGVYFNKDWQGGLKKLTEVTGVPAFSVIRIEKKTENGIVLVSPEVSLARLERPHIDPLTARNLAPVAYPTDDIQLD